MRPGGCAWTVLPLSLALGAALALAGCDDDASAPRPDAADAAPADGPRGEAPPADRAAAEVADEDGADGADAAIDGPEAGLPPLSAKLDLLFVVDNSTSMLERQDALGVALARLFDELAKRPGGMPDLHIGVISSSLGAGIGVPAPECPQDGDHGNFLVNPACAAYVRDGAFLQLGRDGSGNLLGGVENLPAAAGCLVQLGTTGCGYEHHLASLARALDGTNARNSAFLRDDALLAIVILADEDDCSGEPTATFYGGTVMGQAGSLRCALLGHVCGGQPLPEAVFSAPLSTCAPYVRNSGERDTRLINVADFVAAVTAAKKGHAERVFANLIAGWFDFEDTLYTLLERPGRVGTELASGPVCANGGTGTIATPAVRLHAFASAFPAHDSYSICGDLRDALASIGRRAAKLLPP